MYFLLINSVLANEYTQFELNHINPLLCVCVCSYLTVKDITYPNTISIIFLEVASFDVVCALAAKGYTKCLYNILFIQAVQIVWVVSHILHTH